MNLPSYYRSARLLSGSILALISTTGFSQNPASPPNVVLIIADDVSMNDLACYGHPQVKTPHIDALAQKGMRFDNVFLTASSSSPSRASLLTGRYPHNTGACELHSPMGQEQYFFPEALQKQGYYTAQCGKWHLSESSTLPTGAALRAFDRTGGSVKDGGGKSGAEKWTSWLRERPTNRPFFMWFAAHDAHRAWDDDIFLERYQAEEVVVPAYLLNDTATREDLAAYYNEISRFDYFVGQVVQELERQGILEQTCLIIMADNGRPFVRAKTRLIEEGIKTPFIVFYPGLISKGNQVCTSLISSIDIAPTLLELTGSEPSERFQGRSFLHLLSQPHQSFRNYVFAEHNWHDYEAHERMVANESYLLIENNRCPLTAEGAIDVMGGGSGQSLKKGWISKCLDSLQMEVFITPRPKYELYHRASDPYQLHNLAGSKLEVVQKLLKVLRNWKKETGDSTPQEITPDWYSRETLLPLPQHKLRKEMPGQQHQATHINNPGPF